MRILITSPLFVPASHTYKLCFLTAWELHVGKILFCMTSHAYSVDVSELGTLPSLYSQ